MYRECYLDFNADRRSRVGHDFSDDVANRFQIPETRLVQSEGNRVNEWY